MGEDGIKFYISLLFSLAAKYKLTRDDFRELIQRIYDYLPVDLNGRFWENICKLHNIDIHYSDKENYILDEDVISRLADAIWLQFDQEMQHANNIQKKLDDTLKNFKK